MVDTKHPDEAPCTNVGAERKTPEPCTIVIFGASGDLTARKLIPAFYHLFKDKLMPSTFRIVGFARREKTNESWRQELRAALDQFSRTKPVDEKDLEGIRRERVLLPGRPCRRRGLQKT